MRMKLTENTAITKFKEYLQIKTVQPSPDYSSCASFLKQYAMELGFEVTTLEYVRGKPVILMTLKGENPSLPSLLLNSHTDVVPVSPESWTHPPFAAHHLENGNIIARGAQDMKCVGIGYLEALRNLNAKGWKSQRDIHLSFVPDEEIGGMDGMEKFVESEEFRKLKIGCVLDEGIPNPMDCINIYYAERRPWWINIIAVGNTGHGSRFIENSAIDKLFKFIDLALVFSNKQKEKMLHEGVSIGHVTSMNLTILKAGQQHNVIPSRAKAGLDIRVCPFMSDAFIEELLLGWAKQSDVTIEFVGKFTGNSQTDIEQNIYWTDKVTSALKALKISYNFDIFTGATDSRFIRRLGIPAFGITPILKTPVLLHDHDEFLNDQCLLDSIIVYEHIIENLSR